MSSTDVGDAIELTFTSLTGATVTVSWYDPDGVAVLENVAVPESPSGSGKFPKVLVPTVSGDWKATFTAAGNTSAVETYWVRVYPLDTVPPLATVGDVAAQFGTMTGAQESLTGWLVRAASKMVRARFPLIDSQIVAGALDPDVVALVVVNMVLRVLRNPNGLRAESIGPFSRTYDTSVAAGLLAFTDDELNMLVPVAVAARRSAIGTVIVRAGLAPPPYGITNRW